MFPKNAEKIVLAAIALHNFIKVNDKSNTYNPEKFADWEDAQHIVHAGDWRNGVDALGNVRVGSNNSSRAAFASRDVLRDYFMKEGVVSFQFRN